MASRVTSVKMLVNVKQGHVSENVGKMSSGVMSVKISRHVVDVDAHLPAVGVAFDVDCVLGNAMGFKVI
jgi:hypothetical protein